MADEPKPSGSSTPPGEGWDDGRGHAGREPRSSRRRRTVGRTERGKGEKGGTRPAGGSEDGTGGGGLLAIARGLPPWAWAAAVTLLLLLVVLVRCAAGGGGSAAPGRCLQDLARHLPADARAVHGTDLQAARSAGYEDGGSLEELGDTQESTGAVPDALTAELRYGFLVSTDEFTGRTGVAPDDIDCSLGDGRSTVLGGSFDAAEVAGSALGADGRIEATEDRVGYAFRGSDPGDLLEPREDDGLGGVEPVVAALEALREGRAYSVVLQRPRDRDDSDLRVAGLGVADGDGDDRALVVAWVFEDDDAAARGRRDVVRTVNDVMGGVTSISADDLEVDGEVVHGVVVTRRAPNLLAVARRGIDLGDG